MKEGSINCAFFDPPYNNGWKYDCDPTGDKLPPEKYVELCGRWITSAARVLSDEGSIFVLCDHYYCDQIGVEMRKAKLFHQELIVWWETFGTNDQNGLTPCCRFIHYFTKRPSGFIFDTSVREDSVRKQSKDARANPNGKIPTTVWKISRKQGTANDRVPFHGAPPQLPVEVPERCILLASRLGDTILDGFNGNGITAIAALRNGRKYIGIERSPKYARWSRQWIADQLSPQAERKET